MPSRPQSPLQRVIYGLLGAVFLAGMLFFGFFIFLAAACVALVFGIYVWFKTRTIRKQMKENMQSPGANPFMQNTAEKSQESSDGEIIDAEWEEVGSGDKKSSDPWKQ